MRRESTAFSHLQMQNGLLSWHLTQFRGEVVGTGLGSVTQEASLSQKATYQWHSRCQIGSKSSGSSASLGKCSQRCSPVGGQAEQGPVGSQLISEHTLDVWKGNPTLHGWEDSSPFQAVHSVPTEIVYVKHWVWVKEWSVCFSNLYCLGQQRIFRLQSLQTSFIQGEQFRHIKSPTLKLSLGKLL